MSMQIVNLVQGTPEWHAHRAKHFNASDAPAMMGCSSYKTRSELIKELATGLSADIDPATQRRFDDGHRFEALARPLAEEIIGDEEGLSACVGVRGKYSASFDGLTFMYDVAFEHKTLNKALREAMFEGCTGADLPLQYRVQMEQQAMVSGCERILFMASIWELTDGCPHDTDDAYTMTERKYCWYEPDAELRAQIIAGWEQLEKDVAAYDHSVERSAPAVAAPMESLPAVVVEISGDLTVGGNLTVFKNALCNFIEQIPKQPSGDQDFANAEAAAKALKKIEDGIRAKKADALSKFVPVEEAFRCMDDCADMARTARLVTEKLVAAEKDRLRTVLVTGAQAQLDQHIQALNQRLGSNWLPRVAGGFGEVIKGKKSLANMEDAVAVALTNAKHDANQLAARLEANRKHLVQEDGDWITLFADFATVGTKAAEDFQALAALRIGNHKKAEAARLEAQREQIRKEEAERLEREAAAKAKAEAEEAERQRQAAEAQAAQQAKAVIDAAAATQKEAAEPTEHKQSSQQQLEAAQPVAHAAPEAAAKTEGETLKLGQVNTMLKDAGLGQISAETLEANSIAFTKERGAVHIQAADLQRLFLKMAMGMRKLADDLAVTA